MEWLNIKMGRKTYEDLFFFFFFMRLFLITVMQLDTIVVSRACFTIFFNSFSYYSYIWSKNITLTVK